MKRVRGLVLAMAVTHTIPPLSSHLGHAIDSVAPEMVFFAEPHNHHVMDASSLFCRREHKKSCAGGVLTTPPAHSCVVAVIIINDVVRRLTSAHHAQIMERGTNGSSPKPISSSSMALRAVCSFF